MRDRDAIWVVVLSRVGLTEAIGMLLEYFGICRTEIEKARRITAMHG